MSAGFAMGKKQKRPSKKDDLVITPGGPRPKDQVRIVKPGEALRRNEDGTFTVVPIKIPPQK
jgi:hypothetical protein